MTTKQINMLLALAGLAWLFLKKKPMPGAGSIAGLPVVVQPLGYEPMSEIEGGPTGLLLP